VVYAGGTAFRASSLLLRTITVALLTSSLLLRARIRSLFVTPAHHSLQQHASYNSHDIQSFYLLLNINLLDASFRLQNGAQSQPQAALAHPPITAHPGSLLHRCFGSKNPAGFCPYCPHANYLANQLAFLINVSDFSP
jgi:hypothetical protein